MVFVQLLLNLSKLSAELSLALCDVATVAFNTFERLLKRGDTSLSGTIGQECQCMSIIRNVGCIDVRQSVLEIIDVGRLRRSTLPKELNEIFVSRLRR